MPTVPGARKDDEEEDPDEVPDEVEATGTLMTEVTVLVSVLSVLSVLSVAATAALVLAGAAAGGGIFAVPFAFAASQARTAGPFAKIDPCACSGITADPASSISSSTKEKKRNLCLLGIMSTFISARITHSAGRFVQTVWKGERTLLSASAPLSPGAAIPHIHQRTPPRRKSNPRAWSAHTSLEAIRQSQPRVWQKD